MKKKSGTILYLALILGLILAGGYGCKSSDDTPTGPTTIQPGNNTRMVIMTSVDSANTVLIDVTTIFSQDLNAPISSVTAELELTLGTHMLKTECINSDETFICTFTIDFSSHNNDLVYTPGSFTLTQTPADGIVSNDFIVSVLEATL